MRTRIRLSPLLALVFVFTAACHHGTKAAAPNKLPSAQTNVPIQSGVYGFSGAKVADSDTNEGVVGECIWIYDAHNQKQVAKGDCYQNDPGKFRVPLSPGHYIVRGPGGNTSIDVPRGGWTKVESIVKLPLAP
ncbi:MAG: hypothetical protein ACREQ4_12800 [Candidatus Binataceae bacterium]